MKQNSGNDNIWYKTETNDSPLSCQFTIYSKKDRRMYIVQVNISQVFVDGVERKWKMQERLSAGEDNRGQKTTINIEEAHKRKKSRKW